MPAEYFLPTENEWYKAAYYKTGGTNAGYWLYPWCSNTPPVNTLSATGTNNANFFNGSAYTVASAGWGGATTPVGAFASSPGPYGTFDMVGNVGQWSKTATLLTVRIMLTTECGWARPADTAQWREPTWLGRDVLRLQQRFTPHVLDRHLRPDLLGR